MSSSLYKRELEMFSWKTEIEQTKKRAKSLASLDPWSFKGWCEDTGQQGWERLETVNPKHGFYRRSHTRSQTAQGSESSLLFAQPTLQTGERKSRVWNQTCLWQRQNRCLDLLPQGFPEDVLRSSTIRPRVASPILRTQPRWDLRAENQMMN